MIGLTGGIGSGKSTVAARLAAKGAIIIDADQIARDVVEPGTEALVKLVERFGSEILAADGSLDRARLAELAFETDAARQDLEAITHPAIAAEFLTRLAACDPDAIVVHDVPLLAESKAKDPKRLPDYPGVIVVEAPLETRLWRLETRGVLRADAQRRIAQQASDEDRRALATWVIDNAGDLDALDAQIDRIWPEIVALAV